MYSVNERRELGRTVARLRSELGELRVWWHARSRLVPPHVAELMDLRLRRLDALHSDALSRLVALQRKERDAGL
jgi:hypothetical protein